MNEILERAMRLWSAPLPDGEAALSAFRTLYADPVLVNGASTDLQVLVDRARMLQQGISDLHHTVHEVVEAPGRLAFAFTITGRHSGSLTTPLGEAAATGAAISVTGLDIFAVDEAADRVVTIWAVADWLALVLQTATAP